LCRSTFKFNEMYSAQIQTVTQASRAVTRPKNHKEWTKVASRQTLRKPVPIVGTQPVTNQAPNPLKMNKHRPNKGKQPTHGGPCSNLDYDSDFYPESGSDLLGTDISVPSIPNTPNVPGPWEQIRTNADNMLGPSLANQVVDHVERIALFAYKLSGDVTFEQALATCGMYLKFYVSGSVLFTVYDYIKSFCDGDLGITSTIAEKFSAEALSPEAGGLMPVIWDGLHHNKFAQRIAYIIGTVSAVAACKINDVEVNHSLIDSFVKARSSEKINAVDLIDALVESFHWASTVGIQCIRERSLKPMQLTSNTLYKIQARYVYWYSRREEIFSPRKIDGTYQLRADMFEELKTMIAECNSILKYKNGGSTAVLANTVVKPLIDFYQECRRRDANVDFVESAQGYLLYGAPGVGKSSMIPHIGTCVALGLGKHYDKKQCATINLSDAFQDKVTCETETIHVDEISPTRSEFNTVVNSTVNLSLSLVGNTPYQPVRSDLDSKSSVVARHYLTTMASNTETPLMKLMSDPEAFFRRYPVIWVRLKEEYKTSKGRLNDDHPDFQDSEYPDAWIFDVYEILLDPSGKKMRHYFKFKDLNGRLRTTQDIGIRDFEEFLIRRSEAHAKKERLKLLRNMEKADYKPCLVCKSLTTCKCETNSLCSFTQPLPVLNDDEMSILGRTVVTSPSWVAPEPKTFVNPFGPSIIGPQTPIFGVKPEAGLSDTLLRMTYKSAIQSVSRWTRPISWLNDFLRLDCALAGMADGELLKELNHVTDWMMCHALAAVPEKVSQHRFFQYFRNKLMWCVAGQDQQIVPPGVMFKRAVLVGSITASFTFAALSRNMETLVVFHLTALGRYFHSFLRESYRKRFEKPAPFETYKSDRQILWESIKSAFRAKPKLDLSPPVSPVRGTVLTTSIIVGATCGTVFYGVQLFRAALGAPARFAAMQRRINESKALQQSLWQQALADPTNFQSGMVTVAGVAGVVLTGLVMWNTWRKNNPSAYEPNKEAIDGELRKNTWFDAFSLFKAKPQEPALKNNRQPKHCLDMVKNNVVTITRIGTKLTCRGTIIRTGVMVMPQHFFHENMDHAAPMFESVDLSIRWNESERSNKNVRIFKDHVTIVPGKDLVLVYISKCQASRDLTGMLPLNDFTGGTTSNLVMRINHAIVIEPVCAVSRTDVATPTISFKHAYTYKSQHTREGMCGVPVISDQADGCIVGFHVAGAALPFSFARSGVASSLLSGEYEIAEADLVRKNCITLGAECSNVSSHSMGVQVFNPGPAHSRATVFHDDSLPNNGNVEVLGNVDVGFTPKSEITESLLKDPVNQVFGTQREYGPPPFKPPWKQYNRCITAIAHGTHDVNPVHLRKAVEDYISPLLVAAKVWKEKYPERCRALTLDEAINGVEGRDSIPPLHMDTSFGLPFGGAKSKRFIKLPKVEDKPQKWAAPQEVIDEMARINDCHSRGQRSNVFASSFFKDEATPLTKTKCRIVYTQQVATTLDIRTHYMPVIEFLLHHPHLAECAVGINAAGKDWEDLMQNVEKFSKDGLGLGCDYAEYDLRRPANVTNASMTIFRRLAEAMGFPPSHLRKMDMITADLTNPLIVWNGTMVRVWMWVSGNSLTVHVNSMDNSLLFRSCYFSSSEEDPIPGTFRENVALTTYGDDALASVSDVAKRALSFTIYRDYLHEVGMTITTPDKKDTELGFMPMDELDFLKRKSTFIPEIGCRVGSIDEVSIFRQLQYCTIPLLTSKQGERQRDAVDAVGNAAREWFLHGREIYDARCAQLAEVCDIANVHCRDLEVSFDDRVEQWKEINFPSNK